MITNMIKIFSAPLNFDSERKVAHVAIPFVTLTKERGKTVPKNIIRIITSEKESYFLTDDEMEKREQYPVTLPQFPLGESRWSESYVDAFLTDKNGELFNPYLEVFLPIKQALEAHIEFINPRYSALISLWIMATYIFCVFEAFPYLLISGTRGSGKSKLLEILNYLCFNAEMTANTSPSALFRLVGGNLSTVLLDEGESLTGNERDKEIIFLLNAGYKKGSYVNRVNKESHQLERFLVYSPKCVAAISPLDSTLKSRFITITMIKASSKDKSNLRVNNFSADWKRLRGGLYKFALNCGFDVSEVFNNSKNVHLLAGRNNELWSPLLSLAEYIDSFHPDANLLIPLAKLAREEDADTDSLDDWHTALLESLKVTVFVNRQYLIREIRNNMSDFIEDRIEFERISGRWVGNALNRFGFKKAPRQAGGSAYFLDPHKVKDLRIRYGLQSEDSVVSEVNEEESSGDSLFDQARKIFTSNTPTT